MNLQLQGLSAVVTGGTAGIGAAIVKALAREGCDVAFCSRSSDKVEAMSRTMLDAPGRVRGTVLDVSDTAALAGWLADVGKIDILVPNVSALSPDWNASLATDVRGTIATVEAALPYLLKSQHGAITYVGSKAASFGTPGFESYGAAKAAMTHYMKSLARKLAPQGVRVNVVSPGDTFVEGGFWDQIRSQQPAIYDATVAANPLGRLCKPEEVAKVVAFISSQAASFVAGANWLVDGAATDHVHG